MSQTLKIYLIQPDIIWEEIDINLEHHAQLLGPVENADIIVFPEMFATGFTMNTRIFNKLCNEKIINWLKENARKKLCAIIAGAGIYDEGIVYNRLMLVDESGKIQHYNKKHLFGLGKENVYYAAGNERKVFEYKGWRIFPQVCYDLRFPVWSRNDLDYDMIINVANWPAERYIHWQALLRARAIENQCYAIGANRVETDKNNIYYKGGSVIYSFDGTALAEAGEKECIIFYELDKNKIIKYRETFPFLKDADNFSVK